MAFRKMAEKTPRTSKKTSKYLYRETFSDFQESPLGATPRPDLRQHYPPPPPPTELKSIHSTIITESTEFGSSNVDFTPVKKKKATDFTEIRGRFLELRELKPEGSTKKALLILAFIFLSALIALGVVYYRSPRQK